MQQLYTRSRLLFLLFHVISIWWCVCGADSERSALSSTLNRFHFVCSLMSTRHRQAARFLQCRSLEWHELLRHAPGNVPFGETFLFDLHLQSERLSAKFPHLSDHLFTWESTDNRGSSVWHNAKLSSRYWCKLILLLSPSTGEDLCAFTSSLLRSRADVFSFSHFSLCAQGAAVTSWFSWTQQLK